MRYTGGLFTVACILTISTGAGAQAGIDERLVKAAEFGPWSEIQALLARGANVNARNQTGQTPLHFAAKYGDVDLARLLLARGADANARDSTLDASAGALGDTPTDFALNGYTPAERERVGYPTFNDNPDNRVIMVALIKKAAIEGWQKCFGCGSSPRQALSYLTERLRTSSGNTTIREAILDLGRRIVPPPAIPPEAEEFEGRAQSAFRAATSASEMLDAAREYMKVMDIAPWVPGYYYDLCVILEKAKLPSEARRACEFYLLTLPSPEDASAARKLIGAVRKQMERHEYPFEVIARRNKDDGLGWLAKQSLYR